MRNIPVILLITLMAVTACGTQAQNSTATSQIAGTENVPTDDDVAVTPTLQATPLGGNLPGTATSADGTIRVSYPDDWFAQSESGNTVIISNDETLATTTDIQTVESGQAVMLVGTIPREQFEQSNMGLNEMAQAIGDSLSTSFGEEGATFGEPAEGEINGFPSVTLTGTVTNEEQPSDLHIILVDREQDNVILQLVLLAANGESEQFEGTAQEVAGSVGIDAADASDGTEDAVMDETVEVTVTGDAGDGTPDAGTPAAP